MSAVPATPRCSPAPLRRSRGAAQLLGTSTAGSARRRHGTGARVVADLQPAPVGTPPSAAACCAAREPRPRHGSPRVFVPSGCCLSSHIEVLVLEPPRHPLCFLQRRTLTRRCLARVTLGPRAMGMCGIRGFTGLGLVHRKVQAPTRMDQGPPDTTPTVTSTCAREKRDPRWQWGGRVWPWMARWSLPAPLLAAACAGTSSAHCSKWLLCSKSRAASPVGMGMSPWRGNVPGHYRQGGRTGASRRRGGKQGAC